MNIKDLLGLPAAKLKRIIKLKTQIESLHAQLEDLVTGALPQSLQAVVKKKRTMTAAGRKKISLAAKARWARFHAGKSK